MRVARGSGLLQAALRALRDGLDETGAPWMIIGGVAVVARGVRRMTADLDAVVRGDAVPIDALVRMLARHRIVPRIPGATEFARANLVLLLRHEPTGVDLDISFGWSAFEHEALAARETITYGRIKAPMARAEDLVILKAVAARPRDREDAATLLALHPKIDLGRVRRRVKELAELADAPEILETLEQAVALARAAGRRPARRR